MTLPESGHMPEIDAGSQVESIGDLSPDEQAEIEKKFAAKTRLTKANIISVISGLAMFAVAAVAISIFLDRFNPDEIWSKIHDLSSWQIGGAIALTVISFGILSCYDMLALAHIGHKMHPLRVAFIASCAAGVSNAVGLAVLSGGSVRLRMYHELGLRPVDVARIALFVGLSFGLGTTAVAALALAIEPEAIVRRLPAKMVEWLNGDYHFFYAISGSALISILVGYLACFRRTPVRLKKWTLRLPTPRIYLGQIMVAVFDLAVCAAVYYVLLPDSFTGGYGDVILWYCVALSAAYLSHVPGGLGVFDGIIVLGLKGLAPESVLTATLIAFRAIYYLGPLGFALVGIIGNEIWRSRHVFDRFLRRS